ncbi:MAG: hypothetical protein H7230_00390 [Candidatus Parcubacteria bacterium]|nr:hypothetical protein [Candidatus Paceibacterota bacterium]
MLYLSIETSCDDTSIAILYNPLSETGSLLAKVNQTQILGQIVSSQIKTHRKFGGVVPEIGARLHTNVIHYLLDDVLNQAIEHLTSNPTLASQLDIDLKKLTGPKDFLGHVDKICVTTEPGLPSALRVGLELAKTLQFFVITNYNKNIQIKKINHLRGHIASSMFIG